MKHRYELLDTIRALAIINMAAYHTLYDLVYIFGFNILWYTGAGAHIWQQCICRTFICLSGFCLNFGKHPYKRGTTVFLAGVVISLVTAIFIPSERIEFGIMSFMGTSMLLAAASRPLLNKIPPAVGLALVIFLFLITEDIGSGRIGIGAFELFKLPDFLYRGRIMTYLGFTEEGFYSADYFPLFPWFFLFLTGYYLNMLLKDTKIMNLFEKGVAPLNFPGRHSLIIYMLHQPVIYAVLYIMDFFINRL